MQSNVYDKRLKRNAKAPRKKKGAKKVFMVNQKNFLFSFLAFLCVLSEQSERALKW